MSKTKTRLLTAALLLLAACRTQAPESTQSAVTPAAPPMAAAKPQQLEMHGDVRVDDYYWLRERENPEVIAYLEAENAYTEAMTSHTAQLREKLYEEIVSRIPQTDESVPYKLDGYWYYDRYEEGNDYPIYARRKGSMDANEEILLDVNDLAKGHNYYSARPIGVSSGNRVLAFAVDTVGRRYYTVRFRDLESGEFLPDEIPDVTSNGAWAAR